MYYVNVYEVERCYGGAEEGGWWYDTGHPVHSETHATEDEAYEAKDRLESEYPRTGRRYSVLGGEDYNVYVEDHPAEAWPQYRPRYE